MFFETIQLDCSGELNLKTINKDVLNHQIDFDKVCFPRQNEPSKNY